jgi:peptide-methionine (S)-S-oxide reductase
MNITWIKTRVLVSALFALSALTPLWASAPEGATTGQTIKTSDTLNMSSDQTQGGEKMEKAIFAAGCFWGVEANFRAIQGVASTRVGYTGGHVAKPTYKQVCSGGTGHAEAIEVDYDPAQVHYEDLLKVFWENHDPTTLNRQGPDVGSQYRSAIFYLSPEQEKAARKSLDELTKSGKYKRSIVTEITAATEFWMAEDYHQQYLEKRGLNVCH